ncbi:MAG: AAA family ATPase [Fusicatenibacter sp.]|nr:AAA family ATPase [Lachnospiraceae bacterium]MDY2937652.1 AAA family ATPase [Fusicatenibacter sp.]
MKIKKLEIRNFGKLHKKTLEFSEGINLIVGENESGKSTVHTFIRSMLFGLTRGRGRAAKNDSYSRYEPWENPAYYAGNMIFESGGKTFSLTRNFYRSDPKAQLICLEDGEVLSVEDGDLSMLLGGISETVYDNTASIGQLKARTEEGLAAELSNYMANYQGSSDGELDLSAALEHLNRKKKELEQQKKEILEGQEQKKQELSNRLHFMEEEYEKSRESLTRAKEKMKREIYGEEIPRDRVKKARKVSFRRKKWIYACVGIAVLLLILCVMQFFKIASIWTRIGLGAAVAALLYLAVRMLRHHREEVEPVVIDPREQRIRKLQWNAEYLEEELRQKKTELSNLQNEYEEFCMSLAGQDPCEEELCAVNLAAQTIRELSSEMQNRIGGKLQNQMSSVFAALTEGKYTKVTVDEKLQMRLCTQEQSIPLEKVSRGAIEQAYFALRMGAMNVLCGEEEIPVILDEAFVMYDKKRMKQALAWLHENRSQILVFTCQEREEQACKELGIPYRKIEL